MGRKVKKKKRRTKKVLKAVILSQLEDLREKIKKGTPIQNGMSQRIPLLEIIEKNIWKSLVFWGED